MPIYNAEIKRLGWTAEIATRERSVDWIGYNYILPDLDQVAFKKGYDTAYWHTVLRFLTTDPHVWACLQSRKGATLSREWEINEGKIGSVRANRKAQTAISDWMETIDVPQIITEILDAPFHGMAPAEIIWGKGEQWWPEKIVGRPPEWFCFGSEGDLRFLSRDHLLFGEPLPPKKFLLPRHAASYLNPYGERLLSRCFWPVTFKRASLEFWSIFTEKYGMPWPVGKVPRGTSDKDRTILMTMLANMVQDAVAVVNDDEKVELITQGANTSSADIYSMLIRHANDEISKAILGQTLTTDTGDGGGGSYALGKVHGDVRDDLAGQDQRLVAEAFNTLFGWICELNFPGATAPEFKFYEEEDIQADRATRDKTLTEAMDASGLKFSREYWETNYNLEPKWLEDKPKPQVVPVGLPINGGDSTGDQDQQKDDLPDDITEDDKTPGEFAEKKTPKTSDSKPISHSLSLWS